MNKRKIIQQVSPFLILFVISAVFTFPIFKSLHNTGKSDWDQHCFLDEIPRKTILDFGQLPLWNPYGGGGRPLLAHPVVGFLRPTFLFTLFFGCVAGLKIEVFFMVFIGMVGMLLLSRQYGM